MMLRYLLVIVVIFAAPVLIAAQQPVSAAKLYEEAKNYANNRFAEFERKKTPFDDNLYETTLRQQRELALKNAIMLAARPNLAGADFYYLAELYRLGEKYEESLKPYRDFLATNPPRTGEFVAPARMMLVAINLRLKQMEAAEAAFSEYTREHPFAPRADLALVIANRYFQNNQPERALAYAQAAFKASEEEVEKGVEGALTTLYSAGFVIATVQTALRQTDDAVATLVQLRQRAYSQFHATFYVEATLRLTDALLDAGRKPDALKYLDESITALPKRFTDQQIQYVALRQLRRKQYQAKLQGETAPTLDIAQWVGREPVKLEDLRGRVVLLDFWATWCGPCIQAFPHLAEWHKKYEIQGLTIIGVTRFYGEGDGEDLAPTAELAFIKTFKERHRLPYGLAVADNEKTHRAYYVSGIPMAVLIDRAGRIRFTQVGVGPAADKELREQIEKLLAEK